MPTYHYRCSSCDQHLEVVQRMSDDPITECAACGGEMAKVLKPIGIVLKGSGFYRTDNRSGSSGASKPKEATSSDSGSSDSGSSDSGSSDSGSSDSGSSDSSTKSSDSSTKSNDSSSSSPSSSDSGSAAASA